MSCIWLIIRILQLQYSCLPIIIILSRIIRFYLVISCQWQIKLKKITHFISQIFHLYILPLWNIYTNYYNHYFFIGQHFIIVIFNRLYSRNPILLCLVLLIRLNFCCGSSMFCVIVALLKCANLWTVLLISAFYYFSHYKINFSTINKLYHSRNDLGFCYLWSKWGSGYFR